MPTISDEATALVDLRYQAMCRAIAECAAVDEVKDIHDKAMALEVYARQANNFEAERTAQEIRVRAAKRIGALLNERPAPAKGGDRKSAEYQRSREVTIDSDPHPETLRALGISKNQSSQWQQLAAVPDETFEAVMADKSEPLSAQRVLNVHRANQATKEPVEVESTKSLKRMHPDALWLWGLHEVTERIVKIDIDAMLEEMTAHEGYEFMRSDTIENARELGTILSSIGEKYNA
ncbi:hypothetical protein [Paraburkholderia caffeinilytica]|uniref:hypothetical protein n=1 Tax=Paraburkholderia caffeinilytica TaxID=1761016 RepID=UPI003DA0F144